MKKTTTIFLSFILAVFAAVNSFAQVNVNPGSEDVPVTEPQVYEYTSPSASVLNCDNILCFVDGDIAPPNTNVDQALIRLGCSYTMYYGDYNGFLTALGSQTWDLVIFSKITTTTSTAHRALLNAHVLGGGKLLYNDWNVPTNSGDPLFATLGFTYNSSYSSPLSVYAWETAHPAFNVPNTVYQLLNPADTYTQDGHYVTALSGAEKLGGYTTPGPDAGQESIILANDGRTVFFSFTTQDYLGDDNSNSIPDMVEMYENLIAGTCEGFGPLPIPVSNWAILLGIFLIAAFIVVRYRRRLA